MFEREPAALTMRGAAEELSISRAQAYRLAQSGELRTVLVGRRKRVPRWAIEELLAADRALVPTRIYDEGAGFGSRRRLVPTR